MKAVRKRGRTMIGKKIQAIVEGFHPDSELLLRARHSGQCPDIDGQIIINDGRKVTEFGKIYDVEITDVSDYDLIGRVIGAPCNSPKKNKLAFA
jgi:ribosomal protein S12 methylthiotransferase